VDDNDKKHPLEPELSTFASPCLKVFMLLGEPLCF